MTKILLIIFMALSVVFLTAAVLLFTDGAAEKRNNKILTESNLDVADRNEALNKLVDSLSVPFSSKTVFHAKDYRTKDFFTFIQVGNAKLSGYEIVTDLHDIDRHAFDFMYRVCLDSAIDIPFFLETWWLESRCGTNTKHKKNNDGTIDGGDLGINHKDPKMAMKGTPYTDIFQFIKKYRILEKYPRKEWRSRYNSKSLWLKDKQKGK